MQIIQGNTTRVHDHNGDTGDGGPLAAMVAAKDPTGFVNRTTSTLSWSDGSRELTIAPTGASFEIYSAGTRYTKTSTTKQITNTAGMHYIYFDSSGVIQESTVFWDIKSNAVPVATVYWNGTAGLVGDERHGLQMDGATHEMLHETRGAAYSNGLAGTFATDGSTIAIAQGEMYDEDIEWSYGDQSACRMLWLEGTAWKWSAAQAAYFHAVSSVPQYNKLVGGSWSLEPMGSNKYGVAFVYAANHDTTPILVVMGQNEYNTQALAEAVEPSALTLTTLPAAEMVLLYRIVFQRDGAVIVKKSVADYRRTAIGKPSNYVAPDHGTLTGLADDDHPQYNVSLGADADALLGVSANALSLDSQNANTIFAGPSSGAATDPTFRALVAADLSVAFPWQIDIDVFGDGYSNVNWASFLKDEFAIKNGYRQSSGAQNDEVVWKVLLGAGTWKIDVMGVTGSNGGITTVYLDSTNVGTMDWYGSSVYNVKKSITGISVATTGVYALKFKQESKHASSSSYYGIIQVIQLIRTA